MKFNSSQFKLSQFNPTKLICQIHDLVCICQAKKCTPQQTNLILHIVQLIFHERLKPNLFQGMHFPLSLKPQVQPEMEHTRRPKMRRKRRRRQSQRALKPPSNRSGAGTLGRRERALKLCTGWRSAMSTGGLELTYSGGKWRGREFVGAGGPGRV